MTRLSLHRLALAVFALAPLCGSCEQIDQQMDKIFGSMSNVTQPQIVQGMSRGVITGGSVQVRTGVMSTQAIGYTPPSISAGCGGIDAYGGSFSFINKQEFTEFGRKVAANAAGYAFQLALTSLCSSCANTMQKLQSTVNDVNQYFRNSCETAQRAVNATGYTSYMNQLAQQRRASSGDALDTNDAAGSSTDKSPAGQLAQSDPQAFEKLIPGNVLLRALKDLHADNWFQGGDTNLLTDIMSITGTVVVCVPGVDGCTSDDGGVSTRTQEPTAFPIQGTLTLTNLVYGTSGPGSEAGSGSGAGTVEVLVCDSEKCLGPKPTPRADFKGMATLVLNLMIGIEGDASGGLLGKIAHNVGPLTDQEQGFMSSGGLYVGLAVALARRDELAAREFAKAFAPEIAAELVESFMDKIIARTMLAVGINGRDATGKMQDLLTEARSAARADREAISRSLAGQGQALAYFSSLVNVLPPPTMPSRPAPITGTD